MNCVIPLIGRLLLSAIFLASGMGKIFDFAGTQQYMAAAGMVYTSLFLSAAIFLELAGGLMVLLGFKTRIGATLLIIFLIPVTIIFHSNLGDKMQMIMFLKNLSILGGLLMTLSFGAGSISLDSKCCNGASPCSQK